MAVAGWDLSWIFSVSDPKRDPDSYQEYSTLTFHGKVHRPAPFRCPKAEIALSGRPVLPEPWMEGTPQSLGHVEARGNLLSAYLTVPADRLGMLTAAAARIRVISLGGDKLLRRKGLVRSLHVDTVFIPEDW